jgi:hypothetical protein
MRLQVEASMVKGSTAAAIGPTFVVAEVAGFQLMVDRDRNVAEAQLRRALGRIPQKLLRPQTLRADSGWQRT